MAQGVRSTISSRSPDRALLDAALAVNAAERLDEALSVLVQVGRELLEADRVSVIVWDEGLTRGSIRAVAGTGVDTIGAEIRAGVSASYRAALAGEPVVQESTPTEGLDPSVAAAIGELQASVIVPSIVEGLPAVTLQAGWKEDASQETLRGAAEILETLGALTRIAYRMEQERQAARTRASFELVVNSVADGIVVRTRDGISLNATARLLLELDGAEPIPVPEATGGDPADGVLTPPELLAMVAIEPKEQRHFRRMVALPSGREIYLDGTVAPVQGLSGEGGAVAVFRDVTTEHNREFLTEQLLEKLFDSLPVSIVLAEPEKREVLSVNGAFLDLIGYSEAEVVGCTQPYPWLEVDADVDRIASMPPEQPIETLFRHKDGRLIPVEIRIYNIPGPEGDSVAVVALITDLSEQRRFEQQLVQSGKLATIGELAAGVAHEINNPLFAILGLIEFLLKEIEPGTKAYDRILLIQQTGLEIKEIVRALLDFAREPSDERALVSVGDAARETVELLRRTSSAKGIELVEDYTEEPTLVVGSPNQLKQIFLNLVTNASQELRGDGVVEIVVRREGDRVVATVSDNGRGIPEEALARLFEPFFTTKRADGGSGLGLSVSHGIAAAHGGSLTAENRPEGGARFTLSLPAKEFA